MDLILGRFADAHVPDFSNDELRQYDDILQHSDPDLYNWITGQEAVPANFMNGVMEMIVKISES